MNRLSLGRLLTYESTRPTVKQKKVVNHLQLPVKKELFSPLGMHIFWKSEMADGKSRKKGAIRPGHVCRFLDLIHRDWRRGRGQNGECQKSTLTNAS